MTDSYAEYVEWLKAGRPEAQPVDDDDERESYGSVVSDHPLGFLLD